MAGDLAAGGAPAGHHVGHAVGDAEHAELGLGGVEHAGQRGHVGVGQVDPDHGGLHLGDGVVDDRGGEQLVGADPEDRSVRGDHDAAGEAQLHLTETARDLGQRSLSANGDQRRGHGPVVHAAHQLAHPAAGHRGEGSVRHVRERAGDGLPRRDRVEQGQPDLAVQRGQHLVGAPRQDLGGHRADEHVVEGGPAVGTADLAVGPVPRQAAPLGGEPAVVADRHPGGRGLVGHGGQQLGREGVGQAGQVAGEGVVGGAAAPHRALRRRHRDQVVAGQAGHERLDRGEERPVAVRTRDVVGPRRQRGVRRGVVVAQLDHPRAEVEAAAVSLEGQEAAADPPLGQEQLDVGAGRRQRVGGGEGGHAPPDDDDRFAHRPPRGHEPAPHVAGLDGAAHAALELDQAVVGHAVLARDPHVDRLGPRRRGRAPPRRARAGASASGAARGRRRPSTARGRGRGATR